jgi:sulfite exporter TauE/SafE
MIQTIDLLGFLMLGLIGGFGHCVGMCAPFVLFVSRQYTPDGAGRSAALGVQAWYTAGRITTYALLGLAAGSLGGVVELAGSLLGLQRAAAIVAGGALVVWAVLALSDLLPNLGTGGRVFARLSSALRGKVPGHPFVTGLFLGLLPCGLLYSAITASMARGSAVGGAVALVLFGVGTVPSLIGLSVADQLLTRNRALLERVSQGLVLAMGSWYLWKAVAGTW